MGRGFESLLRYQNFSNHLNVNEKATIRIEFW